MSVIAIGLVDHHMVTVATFTSDHVPAPGDEILLCGPVVRAFKVTHRAWKVGDRGDVEAANLSVREVRS